MRLHLTIMAIAVMLVFVSIQSALAAGYVSYSTGSPSKTESRTFPQTSQGLYDALKHASFVEKCPPLIDEVAHTVKDILGQFGLTGNKRP